MQILTYVNDYIARRKLLKQRAEEIRHAVARQWLRPYLAFLVQEATGEHDAVFDGTETSTPFQALTDKESSELDIAVRSVTGEDGDWRRILIDNFELSGDVQEYIRREWKELVAELGPQSLYPNVAAYVDASVELIASAQTAKDIARGLISQETVDKIRKRMEAAMAGGLRSDVWYYALTIATGVAASALAYFAFVSFFDVIGAFSRARGLDWTKLFLVVIAPIIWVRIFVGALTYLWRALRSMRQPRAQRIRIAKYHPWLYGGRRTIEPQSWDVIEWFARLAIFIILVASVLHT